MPPDLQRAMHRALTMGPGYCPPDLFAGDVAAIVSGLKAHAATVAAARHSALSDSFPRTRALLGEARFDGRAALYLQEEGICALSLDDLGRDFPSALDGAASDLARIEWAWLESYRAPDGPALTLASLAGLDASEIVEIRCSAHPANRMVRLDPAAGVEFDGNPIGSPFVILSRPETEVRLTEADAAAARMLDELGAAGSPQSLGNLLAGDPQSATLLVEAGALEVGGGQR